MRSILEQIRGVSPDTPVLLCDTFPSPLATDQTLRATNAAVDKVLEGFPNAHRVKTYEAFLDADEKQNRTLFRDGTHPTAAGYIVWQNALKLELAKYVQNGFRLF